MQAYINAIGTANPKYKISQKKVARFMAAALEMDEREARLLYRLYDATEIDHRYSVLPDYGNEPGEFTFFPNNKHLEPFPRVGDRMKIYHREALKLSMSAINDCLENTDIKPEDITHLITISCTGMYAPGLDIEIVENAGINSSVERTAINFMGCYAAFNGMKLADKICRTDPDATVLMVCVELCSLHFQKSKHKDHLLSNALFSDGAAAVVIQPQPARKSIGIANYYCDLYPEGKNDMAWQISDFGFEMTLSSYVPDMIKGGIKGLTDKLLARLDLSFNEIHYFAIHPGGKRILEVIEEALKIKQEDNRYSYHVLRNFGNMSSPTVLFVLKEIYSQLQSGDDGKNILSFAFGPGLTLESMLLKIQYAEPKN